MLTRIGRLWHRWNIRETYFLNRFEYPNYDSLIEIRKVVIQTKKTCHYFIIKQDKVNKWRRVITLLPLTRYTVELSCCNGSDNTGSKYENKILLIVKTRRLYFTKGLVDYVIDLYLEELIKHAESSDSVIIT